MIRYLNLLCSSCALWLALCLPALPNPLPPPADDSWKFPPELLEFDEAQYVRDLAKTHESVPVSMQGSTHTLWTILGQNEAQGHLHLGVFYYETGKLALAEEEFLNSISLDPENALAHFNLGLALNQAKDWEGARNAYEEAIRLDPKLNIAHTNLGTLHLNRKQYREALENFNTAIGIEPADLKAHVSLGHLYYYVFKNYPAAKKEYRKVLELDPKMKMAKANLTTILKEEKQAREAQKKFEKSLKEEPVVEPQPPTEEMAEEKVEAEEEAKNPETAPTSPESLFKF